MTGYVYVMDRAAGGLKIGRGKHPFTRASQLANQGVRSILAVVTHENEKAVERAAHRLLAARRIKGEWFGVSLPEAVQAISHAVLLVDRMPAKLKQATMPLPESGPFRLGYLRQTRHAPGVEQEQWLLSSGVCPLDIWREQEIECAVKDSRAGDEFLVWSREVLETPRWLDMKLKERGVTLVVGR